MIDPALPPTPPDPPGKLSHRLQTAASTLLGAIVFYTVVPLPSTWQLCFQGIARWVPVVGLGIGALLGLVDIGLAAIGMSLSVRSVLVIAVWVSITGGLHLDGAMDTADGLAVFDPDRRLAVMSDSRSGAFGVMAAVLLLLLKTVALTDLTTDRWLVLTLVAAWGRWGQLLAIVRYPYLRPGGKGELHKTAIHSVWEVVPTLLLLGAIGGTLFYLRGAGLVGLLVTALGGTIAALTGAWFNQKLGGHTGDTYGATVEWTEAILLLVLTLLV